MRSGRSGLASSSARLGRPGAGWRTAASPCAGRAGPAPARGASGSVVHLGPPPTAPSSTASAARQASSTSSSAVPWRRSTRLRPGAPRPRSRPPASAPSWARRHDLGADPVARAGLTIRLEGGAANRCTSPQAGERGCSGARSRSLSGSPATATASRTSAELLGQLGDVVPRQTVHRMNSTGRAPRLDPGSSQPRAQRARAARRSSVGSAALEVPRPLPARQVVGERRLADLGARRVEALDVAGSAALRHEPAPGRSAACMRTGRRGRAPNGRPRSRTRRPPLVELELGKVGLDDGRRAFERGAGVLDHRRRCVDGDHAPVRQQLEQHGGDPPAATAGVEHRLVAAQRQALEHAPPPLATCGSETRS